MVAKERKNKTNKTTPISVNNFVDFIVKILSKFYHKLNNFTNVFMYKRLFFA
jgi:hypothetical protein